MQLIKIPNVVTSEEYRTNRGELRSLGLFPTNRTPLLYVEPNSGELYLVVVPKLTDMSSVRLSVEQYIAKHGRKPLQSKRLSILPVALTTLPLVNHTVAGRLYVRVNQGVGRKLVIHETGNAVDTVPEWGDVPTPKMPSTNARFVDPAALYPVQYRNGTIISPIIAWGFDTGIELKDFCWIFGDDETRCRVFTTGEAPSKWFVEGSQLHYIPMGTSVVVEQVAIDTTGLRLTGRVINPYGNDHRYQRRIKQFKSTEYELRPQPNGYKELSAVISPNGIYWRSGDVLQTLRDYYVKPKA